MTTTMPSQELTLIVAATARHMGIGLRNSLPWTGLKQEMAYFARVTKRSPPSCPNTKNAVIMGRKTWESIPDKFKPLKGRVNVVLSRSYTEPANLSTIDTDKEPLKVSSLGDALNALHEAKSIGRIFVIGGADIYRAALAEPLTKRVLLTRVLTDFECDTYFPVVLGDVGPWKKQNKDQLEEWTGEDIGEGEREENGVKYNFEMYERGCTV